MKKKPLIRKKNIKRSKVPLSRKKRISGQIGGNKRKPTPDLTIAKLKRELDRVFSLYIRAKYPKFCYTCGKASDRLQNGHYISRQFLVTRWDERNCRPQCWGCNGYGKGQPLIFEEKLKDEYGSDLIEQMKHSRHTILKLTGAWYQEQITFYKNELQKHE